MSQMENWATLTEKGYPFTTTNSIVISVAIYLAIVFGIKEIMKKREKFELTAIVVLHNLILSGASLIMLLGVLYQVGRIIMATPPSKSVLNVLTCDTDRVMESGDQTWWFYIFYASKFYELFDTVIIVLRKKPLIFLHVYHHIITMVLVYVMSINNVAVRWLPMVANTSVHIPMYYYYAISSLGMTVWWKKHITKMQIAQFVIDLAGNSTWLVFYFRGESCSCSLQDWFFGQGILLSFLFLFINFFKKTYSEGKIKKENDSTTTTTTTTATTLDKDDTMMMKKRRTPKDLIDETRRGD